MTRYSVYLTNVWWTEKDINVRLFENSNDRELYFGIDSLSFIEVLNFELSDAVVTNITYQDNSLRDIEELLKCNYLILKIDKGGIIGYRYFFAYSFQESGRNLSVDLSLDDITTNYTDYRSKLPSQTIQRAHLNRYVPSLMDKIEFNLGVDSPLFASENMKPNTMVKRRDIIPFSYLTYNINPLYVWFQNNFLGWLYTFVDPYKDFKVFNILGQEQTIKLDLGVSLSFGGGLNYHAPYGTVCVPVMKTNAKIIIKIPYVDTFYFKEWSIKSLDSLSAYNQNVSYFYSQKFSVVPPVQLTDTTYYIDTDGNLVLEPKNPQVGTLIGFEDTSFVSTSPDVILNGKIVSVSVNQRGPLTYYYNSPIRFMFDKSEIIGKYRSFEKEPKSVTGEFMQFTLFGTNGETYSYDLGRVNSEGIFILYDEFLSPEITKYYCRIFGGMYTQDIYSKNYVGCVGSTDNSILLINDQYSQFIANNKNFWLQSAIDIGMSAVSGISGGASGMATGGLLKGIETGLNVDNIKSSPSAIKNASGNVLFNAKVAQNFANYVEISSPISSDVYQIEDYFYYNGYTYGRLDKIQNHDNTRKYFNYIEADTQLIPFPISNIEKSRLRDKLRSVRFWHIDPNNPDYNSELDNYEKWLEQSPKEVQNGKKDI